MAWLPGAGSARTSRARGAGSFWLPWVGGAEFVDGAARCILLSVFSGLALALSQASPPTRTSTKKRLRWSGPVSPVERYRGCPCLRDEELLEGGLEIATPAAGGEKLLASPPMTGRDDARPFDERAHGVEAGVEKSAP